MTRFHFVRESSNEKTGPIPVTTTSADTCPDACPFKRGPDGVHGCYADGGPLGMHWARVTAGERGGTLADLCADVEALPDGQLWRHNQAGDLPGINGAIDAAALRAIVKANNGKRGFTYTHKPVTARNVALVREANEAGFTVNLSANSPAHADALLEHGVPVVAVVPSDTPERFTTPAGNPGIVCPAQTRDGISCADCGLCQKKRRTPKAPKGLVVGFRAHGSSHKRADAIARR
jgi:hypothetical protein